MEQVNCILCGSRDKQHLFSKGSRMGEEFNLVKCRRCGLEFVSPRPGVEDIGRYYGETYFTVRSDRGYDDYFSETTRREIERVMELNLCDLGFFKFEKSIRGEKRVLDIGCAAGYFLGFCERRGWEATGVDISGGCIEFARGSGLCVYEDDYLEITFSKSFNLITLWASIEHLHYPDRFLAKAHDELSDGGRLYISTCRTGGLNFMRLFGSGWRFYNFPEHLFFFSRQAMKKILEQNGFRIIGFATYGSGFGPSGTRVRKIADAVAKRLRMGDMMLVAAEKI